MATRTTNYDLYKPDTTDDFSDFREEFNDNMDIIDQNLGGGGGSGGHTIYDKNGNEMAQETGLQFTGGVTVTDDSQNGKTIVDIQGGSGNQEVTLAEYIALPDTKLTDGKAYYIKDLNNDSVQGYPPLIYSDDEIEVGVWRDGKPLYQKTFVIGSLVNDSQWHRTAHNIANVDKVVYIDGVIMNTSNYSYSCNASRPTTNSGVVIEANETYVTYMNNWLNSPDKLYVTIRYTKTTDTPGSGIWNGQGGIAHHYSTSETVIGTWVDGKPLYEKCFTYSSASFSNQQMTLTNDLSNVDYVVNYGGCAKEPGDNRNIPLPYMRKLANESILLQIMQLPNELVSTSLVTNTSSYTTLQNITIWVQYTKTTD